MWALPAQGPALVGLGLSPERWAMALPGAGWLLGSRAGVNDLAEVARCGQAAEGLAVFLVWELVEQPLLSGRGEGEGRWPF